MNIMYTFGTFVLYIFDVQIDGYSHLLLSKFAKVLKNYAFANELRIYIEFLKYIQLPHYKPFYSNLI